MGIAEEQRRLEAVYRTLLPEIVAVVSRRDEPVAAAETLAERGGVDTKTAYRWITLTEQELDGARRRQVIVALIPLWGGILTALITGVLILTGRVGLGDTGVIVAGAAALLAVIGSIALLVHVGERSARGWLRRKMAREETG
ncbi:MAG: hypothetical protein ACLFR8_08980 [Alkalispirochaeta sp.]